MTAPLVLARPRASDQPVLRFHGVGSSAKDLGPWGLGHGIDARALRHITELLVKR